MGINQHLIGLSDAQVIENRHKYGENVLTPPKRIPLWKLFLEKFEDPVIRVLLIAALLSLAIAVVNHINTGTGEYAETIGIFCAIFLATGVAWGFETNANRKFDVLNLVNDDTPVRVIRNGNVCEIPKRHVVVGDIVLLEVGEEVPADGKLLEAISLQMDESCLTGESVIAKTIHTEGFDKEATYPSDWVMRGTKVMDGHGIMEVKNVGDATEYGKVAEKSTEITGEETPLNKELAVLAKLIGVVGFGLAALTFSILFIKDLFFGHTIYSLSQLGLLGAVVIGVMTALVKVWVPILYDAFDLCGKKKKLPKSVENGSWIRWIVYGTAVFVLIAGCGCIWGINPLKVDSWVSIETAGYVLQYFMVAVTLVVVAVPEGLPMSVTLSLALSMRRMLKTNNLVRKMHACETMGAITVICTDKTGTLTQNRMQVYQTNFYGTDEKQLLGEDTISRLIKENISVNSTAFLDCSNSKEVRTIGNPTEAALLLWLNSKGINFPEIRENAQIIQQLTFSTERKYMATLVESPLLNKKVLYLKGAPEIILSKCSDITEGTSAVVLSAGYKTQIEKQLLHYQNQAMRTLGFAYKFIEIEDCTGVSIEELAQGDAIFLGFVAISDPVRANVPYAVEQCMSAGIHIKIVTGDTPGTAKEIARQIGIWKEDDTAHNLITGVEFEALSDTEASQRIRDLKIMCRARPTDKQRLVHLLQQNGEIVAVTGDGTNDAPALNYAHIGLSMGTGTSVAKEASDITLLDDSFNSISTAVMWGRSLYQNIQRFVLFQLTINTAALTLVFLGSILGFELPLTVTQMLWINLIMDTFAAGALASLPPNPEVMKDKPRKNSDFIISKSMCLHIFFVSGAFILLLMSMLFLFKDTNTLANIFSYIPEGERPEYSLSYFFTVFVMLQFWNLFNAKAFLTGKSAFTGLKNSYGFIAVAFIVLIGQIFIVEFGGEVFRTVPLTVADWLIITGATSFVLWIGEVVRRIKR
ncbi:Calcium-transporting ATPase 1 [termite gut metagenome]|uniref:Calcium-transporting ATPase 1 n=1 Tax=termite gut metagenome TaxID=433724 RepID=A0A5J4S777_9ZZZZ